MSVFAQQWDETDYEAELEEAQAAVIRAEARRDALLALHRYESPLNRNIRPAELMELMASDAPEEAGIAGDLPVQED